MAPSGRLPPQAHVGAPRRRILGSTGGAGPNCAHAASAPRNLGQRSQSATSLKAAAVATLRGSSPSPPTPATTCSPYPTVEQCNSPADASVAAGTGESRTLGSSRRGLSSPPQLARAQSAPRALGPAGESRVSTPTPAATWGPGNDHGVAPATPSRGAQPAVRSSSSSSRVRFAVEHESVMVEETDGVDDEGSDVEEYEEDDEDRELRQRMDEENARRLDEVDAKLEAELQAAIAELAAHMKEEAYSDVAADVEGRMARLAPRIKGLQSKGQSVRAGGRAR
eukprot:TRINITY_DN30824_c0_g1_i1.p1 TRINITY_DN30824_c0_g1~~TRINITY_DN30824_c0_g1_i1.p1  ORF type:complete len:296 (-),score=43.66 TRINITY_DN30824_c0_g1_i1:211-1053(-)